MSYANNTGFLVADLLETKLIINSTISNAIKRARFICLDIKDHFLVTLMVGNEYMRVKSKYILANIKSIYNIDSMIDKDNLVYIKIQKDMPRLK